MHEEMKQAEPRYWRTLGVAMASAGGLLMLVNAARAFADPGGFATYLGLPLVDAADAGLIRIYGLRALFIGLLVGGLLLARQRTALWMVAAIAVVMPAGDAWLTQQAGAPGLIVGRHLAIAVYLAVTAWVLRRAMARG
jgi:hypothetical protein